MTGARRGGGLTKPSMDETIIFKKEKKINEITAELNKRWASSDGDSIKWEE